MSRSSPINNRCSRIEPAPSNYDIKKSVSNNTRINTRIPSDPTSGRDIFLLSRSHDANVWSAPYLLRTQRTQRKSAFKQIIKNENVYKEMDQNLRDIKGLIYGARLGRFEP